MEQLSTVWTKLALTLCAVIFGWQVYRAAIQPVSSAEAYQYDRFVRPTFRQTLARELPNRELLYTLLEKRSVGLFHLSPFSIRLPSLLFAILYLWSAWRIGRLLFGSGPLFFAAVGFAGLIPLAVDCFSYAGGLGAALALQLLTIHLVQIRNLNLAGTCLGLSVAACLGFAIPAAVLAALLLVYIKQWDLWADRILVPACVAALVFLVLPLSHAHASPELPPAITVSEAAWLQSALHLLRSDAGSNHARIAASAAAEPIVNFYRAEYRMSHWERAERNLVNGGFDYYFLVGADTELADQRHLVVLSRDGDFLLARKSSD